MNSKGGILKMKHRTWIFSGFTLISITLLMVYDFFPELNGFIQISKPVFIGLVLLILFSGFFLNRTNKESSPKLDLIRQVILSSYLLVLIVTFTLLGGVSQVGISLSNPFLWIVLMITLYEYIKQYKKMKTSQSTLTL